MKLDDMRKLRSFDFQNSPEDHERLLENLRAMGMDPNNLYQELEMSSRYVDSHQDVSYSNAHVQLHSHAFYELLYCRSCEGVEYLVGSDRYKLQKGDIIMVPPGISHRPILPGNMPEPYIRDVIWLNAEFAGSLLQMFPDLNNMRRDSFAPIRTAGTRWEFLGNMFRNGVKEAQNRRLGWEASLVGNTIMIITWLKRIYWEKDPGVLKAERRDLLDEVMAYIESSYTTRLTMNDIARRFYVSDSTISHLFKQKMGVSLYRYVTQRRLIAAKNLITGGTALELVAEQVGFTDYSAFYRAFKREYGISPREFRKMGD